MTSKPKAKLGIELVVSDNKSLVMALNAIKAQGAWEMIDCLMGPWTPAESAYHDSDRVFCERIETQRKLLKKIHKSNQNQEA